MFVGLRYASNVFGCVGMDMISEPKLAPPGAGLLLPELMIARVMFGFRRMTGTRDVFNELFSAERVAIRSLVDRCEPESLAKRVLIERIFKRLAE